MASSKQPISVATESYSKINSHTFMDPIKKTLCTKQPTYNEIRMSDSAVRRTRSILCIEDLSNEIFYDIFDYLDGCDLYQAFSNLNIHFENLLINSYLLLKINLNSNHRILLEYNCLNIINPNQSHILSINLSNTIATKHFLKFITINSLYIHLQSFVINGIPADKLGQFLIALASLPHLYSLIITVTGCLESFDRIYQSIFRLPFLKYNKLSYGPWRVPVLLSFARIEQFTSVERLNIDIDIELPELISILSYTPQLYHLTCRRLFNSSLNIARNFTIKLLNLTHVYLDRCRLQFHEFEIFIRIISSQLQVLRFTTTENIEFLDANRWQTLILQFLPQLHKFEFAYKENIPNNFQLNEHHQQINQFTSSFWIERQWYFQVETDTSFSTYNRIIYSIHSYRKKWYHLCQDIENEKQDKNVNSLTSNFEDIELNAINRFDFGRHQLFIKKINFIFQIVRITCLNIDLSYSSIKLLINFINHLPNLNSLSVSCLPSSELDISINETSNKNKITKVNLEKMITFEQIQYLVDLCPHVEYLQIGCTNNFNFDMLNRFILMKNNAKKILKLNSLCFCVPTADEKMIEKFQTNINLKKLLCNYSIKRIFDKIYFQWK